MPPVVRPPLPRSAADPIRLQSLRQRALARMAQDEHSARTLTRRRSIQRFALLAAALTPVARRLFRGQQALAATPRTNVPQYGAPPQYHPPPAPPYPDYTAAGPKPIHALPATRAMLGSVKNWAGTSAELLGPTGWGPGSMEVPAWSILYSVHGAEPFPITAVADHVTGNIYFVRGNHPFYFSNKSDIYAGSIGKGVLILRRSLFKFKGTKADIADAVTQFAASVDDHAMKSEESRVETIDITPGIPFEFWNSAADTPLPTISYAYYYDRSDQYPESLNLYLLSPNGKYTAAIHINPKAKVVTKTELNDKPAYDSGKK